MTEAYISLDEERDRLKVLPPRTEKEAPRPLTREIAPSEPFPVDALGPVLKAAALAIHDRIQAPLALCAQSVLAAATFAVQNQADVVLPIGAGQPKPISSLFASIAASGERKSACDSEATRAIRDHQDFLAKQYREARAVYEDEDEVWKKAREVAKNKAKGDPEVMKLAFANLGPGPTPPLLPILLTADFTIEGLSKLLENGQPGIGLFATEGGQFAGGHSMSRENKLKTAAGISSMWDGEVTCRVRAGDGFLVLRGRRVSAHLMFQPEVARYVFADRELEDQGLLSRVLPCAPPTTSGTRFHRPESPETARSLSRYNERLTLCLTTPPPLLEMTRNELQPRHLMMNEEAQRRWHDFADHIEAQIAPGGALEQIRGLANKLPEHAARLAAVLVLIEGIQANQLDAETMTAGMVLAEYYAKEGLRLIGASFRDPDLALAEKLRVWLLTSWPENLISIPDIYQRSLNAISDKATATKLVTILEDHGWLKRVHGGAVVKGRPRREVWEIQRV